MKKEFYLTELPEVKRFYLEGVEPFEWECPKCAAKHAADYAENRYLSYPEIGANEDYLWCSECDYEHPIKIDVQVKIGIEI